MADAIRHRLASAREQSRSCDLFQSRTGDLGITSPSGIPAPALVLN